MEEIAKRGGLQGMTEVPEKVRRVFVTAHEIAPHWHVEMQAAFQRFTHNAVSKTVNFKREATREDVKTVFLDAYEPVSYTHLDVYKRQTYGGNICLGSRAAFSRVRCGYSEMSFLWPY